MKKWLRLFAFALLLSLAPAALAAVQTVTLSVSKMV